MWPQNMGKIIIIGGIIAREVPWNKLILWEHTHKKYVEKAAWVKQMLTM